MFNINFHVGFIFMTLWMSQPSSNEGVPTVNTQYKMKAIQISNTPLDSLHNKAFLRTGIQFGQYLQDRGEKDFIRVMLQMEYII